MYLNVRNRIWSLSLSDTQRMFEVLFVMHCVTHWYLNRPYSTLCNRKSWMIQDFCRASKLGHFCRNWVIGYWSTKILDYRSISNSSYCTSREKELVAVKLRPILIWSKSRVNSPLQIAKLFQFHDCVFPMVFIGCRWLLLNLTILSFSHFPQ